MQDLEKKVNLDGIMYDENGSFVPFTGSRGNIYADVALVRNTYMDAEKEYFEQLLANDALRKRFYEFMSYNTDVLYETAMKIHDDLENGNLETKEELEQMKLMTPAERDNFHNQKLYEAEGMMCLLLAAIRDKIKILELVKQCSNERSR